MVSYWLIACHFIGDYWLQSDWMAQRKTKSARAAMCHAIMYTLPFAVYLRLTHGLAGSLDTLFLYIYVLSAIALTHYFIDHYRLARYVCYAKNFLAPQRSVVDQTKPGDEMTQWGTQDWWHPWEECKSTGYHENRPEWLSVWLLIITDNTMHLLCNGIAWSFL